MPKKQTTDKISTIAAKVLAGKKPTKKQILQMAGSVLVQDEKKRKRKSK